MSEKTSEENEFDPRAVARQIAKIEEGLRHIERGGLNRRAIVALIHDSTKLGKRTIEVVLDGLAGLRAQYVAFPVKKPKS